jgi:hypothetical protein
MRGREAIFLFEAGSPVSNLIPRKAILELELSVFKPLEALRTGQPEQRLPQQKPLQRAGFAAAPGSDSYARQPHGSRCNCTSPPASKSRGLCIGRFPH